MLSQAKLIEKITFKAWLELLAVVYLLGVICAISAVYYLQNHQHRAVEVLALSDKALNDYAITIGLSNEYNGRLLNTQEPGYRQLAISDSRWFMTFEPPIYVVLTSPLLIIFTLFLLLASNVLRKRLQKQLVASLQPIKKLEDWANLTVIQGVANDIDIEQPSREVQTIAFAIRGLQEKIHDSMASDIAADQTIRASALLDQETHIGNRAFFDNRLQAFLREEDAQGAVLLIQFKEIDLVQKLYGYQQAMTLLSNLIQVTKQRLQELPSYFLARHSDFELSVLMPSVFMKEVEKIADRLLKNLIAVATPVGISHEEFVHIGISYFNAGQVPYQIMSEADMALRSAQLQGPSQWFMFEAGELETVKAKGSLKWRTFLSAAINGNGFVIFFQPLIAADNVKVLHHEVLTKVRDKNGTLVSARVFFPMAKKCGLTVPIDLLILEQVCRVLAYEKDQQDSCSINVSVDSLLSEGFIDQFLAIYVRFPAISDRLMIEIGEYQLVNHLAELQPAIAQLSHAGIKIIADKVGQYVVSAHYINVYPIFAMKLHQSLILDLDKKVENQVFIQSLKNLAKNKNIPTYALGIEKHAEWRTLQQLGIQGGQGHYFTEPVAQVAKAIHLD